MLHVFPAWERHLSPAKAAPGEFTPVKTNWICWLQHAPDQPEKILSSEVMGPAFWEKQDSDLGLHQRRESY